MSPVNLAYIVDDDPIYVFGLKKIIQYSGYCDDLHVFKNGLEALKNLQDAQADGKIPQVILLDINMPIMNGWDFLVEFSKLDTKVQESTKIYIISSSIDQQDYERSKDFANVERYLIKPVGIPELKQIFNLEADQKA